MPVQAPELLEESTPSVVASAAGAATFTFQPPEAGWVWNGSIQVAAVPPTIGVPPAATWTVLVGSAFWGNYSGGAPAQVGARGAKVVQVIVTGGLTPGQAYQAVWNGGKVPIAAAPFLYPFPGTGH